MAVRLQEELLALAAAETRNRIRNDRENLPAKLQPLLRHVEDHLFDPDLDVNHLKRCCGVRSTALLRQFHLALNQRPHSYITRCRAETATRLLQVTQLKIEEIGPLLGYRDGRAFSRAFHRALGQKPSEYRAKVRQEVGSSRLERNLKSYEVWREALDGNLERAEAAEVVAHLQKLYALETGEKPLPWPTDGASFERFTAQQAWDRIRDMPFAEQKAVVLRQARFSTSACFDLLRQKSREAGRKDRRQGVRLAELAIVSLDGSAELLGDRLPALQARGWAWLGNARRLALDYLGAEEALDSAAALNRPKDALAAGEICLYQASLRLYQRRFEEALELDDRAVRWFRLARAPALLAQALIVRANIRGYSGELEGCASDLKQTISLLQDLDEPFLLLTTHVNLALTYSLSGMYGLAANTLPTAKRLCNANGTRLVHHQLQWIEAILRIGTGDVKGGEELLLASQSGLLEIREADYGALVSLELAILYAESGRDREALHLAAQTISVFQALNIPGESTIALNLLSDAVRTRQVSTEILCRLRDCLIKAKAVDAPGVDGPI